MFPVNKFTDDAALTFLLVSSLITANTWPGVEELSQEWAGPELGRRSQAGTEPRDTSPYFCPAPSDLVTDPGSWWLKYDTAQYVQSIPTGIDKWHIIRRLCRT